MNVKSRTFILSLALAGAALTSVSAQIRTYFLTFASSGYTTDGTNTWNSFELADFENASYSTKLNDAGGTAGAGLEIVDAGITGEFFDNSGNATSYPSLTWFDASEGDQTSFFSFTEDDSSTPSSPQKVSFQLTGLNATDEVSVQWIASRSGSGTRDADFTVGGSFSNLIAANAVSSDDFVTNADPEQYMEWSAINPDSSGNLVLSAINDDGFAASFGNAMRIEVAPIPEPSSAVLLVAGFAAFGAGLFRRRRKN